MNNVINSKEQINYNIRIKKEIHLNEKIRINNSINELYDKVITPFQLGEVFYANPIIIPFLTKDMFIEWIIDNNKSIKKILNT